MKDMLSGLRLYPDLIQGSDEWFDVRRGIITASEVGQLLTPGLKLANNETARTHVWELLAQRISGFIEPTYIGFNAERGHEDEMWARVAYAEHFAPVEDMGFMSNDKWGFTLGYSPDGIVGDDGLIECKSRVQKYQVKTIIEHVATGSLTIPKEFLAQCQCGLLVSERKWLDFISYSGGLPMAVIRVWPDDAVQAAILEAAAGLEAQISSLMSEYREAQSRQDAHLIPTVRRVYEEITT